MVILAVNQPHFFATWQFTSIISDLILELTSFQSWNALKVSRCGNCCAYVLTK